MAFARPTLVRLLRIHQALSEGHYPSLERLAQLCEVHPRTIKRDLRLLREEFRAPLTYSAERGGYGYDGEFSLVPAPFHERELLALSLAIEVASAFRNTPFAEAVRRGLDKLRAMMPNPTQAAFEDLTSAVAYVPDPAPPERIQTVIHFNELLDAIHSHHQVRLTYHSLSGKRKEVRVVDPYQLYLHGGMWYVHGFCHLRHRERTFALTRILALERLRTTFAPPDPEALRARFEQRFSIMQGELRDFAIWFDPEAARRIEERTWHPSQQITPHDDGSCTLRLRVEGLSSVLHWLLQFGRHAVPLAPPELVERFRAEVQAMARPRKLPPRVALR